MRHGAARLQHAAAHLVEFQRFEQRLEVAFAEALVALALDDLEEDRADDVLGEYLEQQALTLGRLLGTPVAPLLCVHHAHVQGGGLRAQGVAIVPATLLRSALGFDRVLSDADVEQYAATAKARLGPAA